MNESTAVVLAAVCSGLLTGFINVAVVSRSRGKFEGEVKAQLTAHHGDIEDLKRSRGEQWEKINDHGERLSFMEGKQNGKGAGR